MSTTALYRAYDGGGRLLYVGIAADAGERMKGHEADHWHGDIAAIDVTLYPDWRQAKTAETEAITTEWPLWNIRESPWGCIAAVRARRRRTLADVPGIEVRIAHAFHVLRLTRAALTVARHRLEGLA